LINKYLDKNIWDNATPQEWLDSFHPTLLPTQPQEFKSYLEYPIKERLQISDKFFKQDFIQKYMNERWKIELENKSDFEILYEFRNTVFKDSLEIINIINKKLLFYKRIIKGYECSFPALRIDFNKYNLPDPLDALIKDLNGE